jgi:hypothetical protein
MKMNVKKTSGTKTLTPYSSAGALCVGAMLLAAGSASAQNSHTGYVGNPPTPFDVYAQPDGVPPLVIMGEYNPAGPSPDTVQPLPSGVVQDVEFYGQNYDFTLYALAHVAVGPGANEQAFVVVSSEHFSGTSDAPGPITLSVSNFRVKKGDFLAFSGIGPWYPQQLDDALNTDATYEDAVQPDPYNDNDTATPPVLGEFFSVGPNRDSDATYGYIADNFGNQGRIYAIGVDVKKDRLDLSGADLRRMDLSGLNLQGVNFSHSDLERANLQDADLVKADFRDANMRNANLSGALLSDANLRNADLQGADLSGADLTGADLRNADLRNANFTGAIITGTKF